ncbi:helix-turn-helix transcriptional regulator [Streptomyces acidiscabies]|uniref:Helix-turn-helix domain-containing protein n=1 Tax=Streptomyces acidiscabies TaxID=42234 RepID=A0ABU4MA53_9ACTN|nr:helix-turn-helix domain-containing protein [Streptomyces acidiscabies]MDX3024037.1 helix-turn-helix domain-containing protein [Streptomyces acidiscabies]
MTQDWARLGSFLRASREDELRLTQEELAERLGVGRNALGAIEAGKAKRITPTIRAYAREVGWTDDSIALVLAGGDPVRVVDAEGVPALPGAEEAGQPADVAAEVAQALLERLPQRVLQELVDGHVVDSDVVDLREDGSSAVMTLVLERGAAPASPERVRDDLRAWTQVQRELRRMLPRTEE